jgi:acetyl-CoA/propionyl-CoA carboxylase biotin carboxyl carrier protein
VEHTVSEMVFGIDLVKGQLRVAAGEKLWITQDEIVPRGHSIECRVIAEDTLANFRPALGTIKDYQEPVGLGVRVDSGVRSGWRIPEHYDSLLAKLVTWGIDREECIARMRRALIDYKIEGVITSIPFFRAAMEHPVFVKGEATVNFIPWNRDELMARIKEYSPPAPTPEAPEEEEAPRTFQVEVNSRRFNVRVLDSGGMQVAVGAGGGGAPAAKGGKPAAKKDSNGAKPVATSANAIVSPLQGVLSDIRVKPGQDVKEGQVIFIVQAMKMENEITAPRDGTVNEIRVENGVNVQTGTVLATYNE